MMVQQQPRSPRHGGHGGGGRQVSLLVLQRTRHGNDDTGKEEFAAELLQRRHQHHHHQQPLVSSSLHQETMSLTVTHNADYWTNSTEFIESDDRIQFLMNKNNSNSNSNGEKFVLHAYDEEDDDDAYRIVDESNHDILDDDEDDMASDDDDDEMRDFDSSTRDDNQAVAAVPSGRFAAIVANDDFVVRCFVLRLRQGMTVVKHCRSRWCKSRLRCLQLVRARNNNVNSRRRGSSSNGGGSTETEDDNDEYYYLTWKAAEWEPASSKRPPKLDLRACLEVRHATTPDPDRSRDRESGGSTKDDHQEKGTSVLRRKCQGRDVWHKSFSLVFGGSNKRTVDITAVTPDQCSLLMEGFAALCARLQRQRQEHEEAPTNNKTLVNGNGSKNVVVWKSSRSLVSSCCGTVEA